MTWYTVEIPGRLWEDDFCAHTVLSWGEPGKQTNCIQKLQGISGQAVWETVHRSRFILAFSYHKPPHIKRNVTFTCR